MANIKPGPGKIFENRFLEALTKTHIAIPLTMFWSAGAIGMWYSIARLGVSWVTAVMFFLIGALFFTLGSNLTPRCTECETIFW